MYAADRACVNTLDNALDLCDQLGDGLGVAYDVNHVWWDPDLPSQTVRQAGASSPITSATGWCRRAICCSTAACRATASSTCAASAAWWRRPAMTGFATWKYSRRRNWWLREPAEVLRICLERHQTVV